MLVSLVILHFLLNCMHTRLVRFGLVWIILDYLDYFVEFGAFDGVLKRIVIPIPRFDFTRYVIRLINFRLSTVRIKNLIFTLALLR